MENSRTYHIIGAGIAGLYTAKLIKEKYPLSCIILYEAAEKIGGRCGSYFDSEFNCNCDNATHVILNCNSSTKKLITPQNFKHSIRIWDLSKQKFSTFCSCFPETVLAIFNTSKPNWRALGYAFRKLFPFIYLRAYFSQGNLSEELCAPLLQFTNDIKYGYIWQGIESSNGKISKLIFNKQSITVSPQDTVISAIDSFNYHKIMGGYDFEYNAITNIFYRTSMALTLPNELKMLGLKKALGQWLFCTPDYTSVIISNTTSNTDPREIWTEICKIRNYNSAFIPTFKVRTFPLATIRQDKKNNAKRPTSAKTKFANFFICGDWTMKNKPCCIETAILSAQRIMKYL